MMRPAKNRHSDDLARIAAGLPWCRNRDALSQLLVWPHGVEIPGVLAEHALHVPLTEDDDVIEGFTAYTSKKTFAHGVHDRRRLRTIRS